MKDKDKKTSCNVWIMWHEFFGYWSDYHVKKYSKNIFKECKIFLHKIFSYKFKLNSI